MNQKEHTGLSLGERPPISESSPLSSQVDPKNVLPNAKAIFLVFVVFLFLAVYAAVGDMSGGVGSFVFGGLQVLLFVLLAMTAYLAEVYSWLKIPALLFLLILVGFVVLVVTSMSVMAVLPDGALAVDYSVDAILEDIISLENQIRLVGVVFFVILSVFVSCIGFSRRVRTFLARYLPFDPDSFVHMIALVTVSAITMMVAVPLFVFGEPILLTPAFLEMGAKGGADIFMESMTSDIYNLFWTILASFLVVGLFIRRNISETLERLGLFRISLKELGIAIGLGIVLVGIFHVVDTGIGIVWEFFGWKVTDMDAAVLTIAPLLTPVGAIVAAVGAGFGEELSIRGVLQPRFGILLPTFLFASLHAFQYNWDGVLSVFLAGLVFALIRRYYCTTVSAITHTFYDLILFYALMFGLSI